MIVALRRLSVKVERPTEIPDELAEWIAQRTPEDPQRIREDVKALERLDAIAKRRL